MRLRSTAFIAAAVGTLACWSAIRAQQPAASVAVIPGDQQLLSLFHGLAQHSSRLLPLLDQVHTSEWVARGAPETYTLQLSSARQQIQGIESDMSALVSHPERLQDCMRALFRVQTLHRSLDSLMGGLRRYQNPALADLIQAVAGEDQEDLAKMQDYILELANQREQEYQVVDHEAQRCRAAISREPSATRKTK